MTYLETNEIEILYDRKTLLFVFLFYIGTYNPY